MLVKLLVNHLYITGIKREQYRAQLKINDLKFSLYEKRQEFRSNTYKPYTEAVEAEVA
jgi:hypothetical protein